MCCTGVKTDSLRHAYAQPSRYLRSWIYQRARNSLCWNCCWMQVGHTIDACQMVHDIQSWTIWFYSVAVGQSALLSGTRSQPIMDAQASSTGDFVKKASRYVNMRSPLRSVNIFRNRNPWSLLHTKREKWSAIWKQRGVWRKLEGENVQCVRRKRMLFTHIWIIQKYRNGEYMADYKWRGNAKGDSVV